MNLNDAYVTYKAEPNCMNLNNLFTCCHSYAGRLVSNSRQANPDDLIQDILSRAWESLYSFHGGSFRSWFRVLALNVIRDSYRRLEPATLPVEVLDTNPCLPASHGGSASVSTAGLTVDQIGTLQVLITTQDFAATAQKLGVSRATLSRRLSRIKKIVA
jgi:DNA-directed RNA polymerase specialized sigma24 family protein